MSEVTHWGERFRYGRQELELTFSVDSGPARGLWFVALNLQALERVCVRATRNKRHKARSGPVRVYKPQGRISGW